MEMEELKNKYSFSDGLMEKIKHSIEVLRKGEEFALRFYDKGYYLASAEVRIVRLFTI